jgi:hypothetical protein
MEYHGVKLGLAPKIQITHDHQNGERNNTNEKWHYRYIQSKLVEYTNILKPLSIRGHLGYLYRKLLVSFLLLDKQSMVQYHEEIRLLQNYKIQIQNSRKINNKKQPSWL